MLFKCKEVTNYWYSKGYTDGLRGGLIIGAITGITLSVITMIIVF